MSNWILKRKDTNDVIELHRQYSWSDQHDWTPLAQSDPVYTLSGAMDIQQGTRKAGRPITLDSTYARITRGEVEMLQGWSAVPELEMELTHPSGAVHTVIFARPAISDAKAVRPVRPSDELPTDPFTANIHFTSV